MNAYVSRWEHAPEVVIRWLDAQVAPDLGVHRFDVMGPARRVGDRAAVVFGRLSAATEKQTRFVERGPDPGQFVASMPTAFVLVVEDALSEPVCVVLPTEEQVERCRIDAGIIVLVEIVAPLLLED